tara:strand:+ start:226 stop:828 length:603 start_codon:yes stop_codon:yes gene_type:complete
MLKTVSSIATQIISSITGGLIQFTGPASGSTRIITVPNADATMARTDAAQTFAGIQTMSTYGAGISTFSSAGVISSTATAGLGSVVLTAESSFTASTTGLTAVVTGTISTTRAGNVVTLSNPNIFGTSNSGTFTLTGMPSTLWPNAERRVVTRIYDNSTHAIGYVIIGTNGVMTFSTASEVPFTIINGKGAMASSITYMI